MTLKAPNHGETKMTTAKYDWQLDRARDLAKLILTETTTYPSGAMFWKSSGNPVPMDSFRDAGITPPMAQETAIEEHTARFLAEYRRQRLNRKPSAEEMFEMQAAFGPDAEVVDVITGQRFRTGR